MVLRRKLTRTDRRVAAVLAAIWATASLAALVLGAWHAHLPLMLISPLGLLAAWAWSRVAARGQPLDLPGRPRR